MINEKVLDFLKAKGYADRLTEHKETIDTVEHAAQQIGCSEAEPCIADESSGSSGTLGKGRTHRCRSDRLACPA